MGRQLRTLKVTLGKYETEGVGRDHKGSVLADVVLDVERLIATRMLVCANSGGGKSHAIRLIVEAVAAYLPTIVIDPEGEFRTLREVVDLVIVGPNGDVAATIGTAEKLARRLAELNVSAVIDISDLSPVDQRRFVHLFLTALLHLPQGLWSPRLIVLDEAHKFAPEDERDAVSRGAVEALMAQGRKRQLGTILATQRLRKLSKNAAAEGNNLLLGRFAQDLDLKRAADLLGISKDEWSILQRFKEGEFFALGPAISPQRGRLRFRTSMTKTTAPRVGGRMPKTPQPSKAIQKIVPELADLQVQVQAEQNELLALRAKVKELSSRKPVMLSRDTVKIYAAPEQIEAAHRRGFNEAMSMVKRTLTKAEGQLEHARLALKNTVESIESTLLIGAKVAVAGKNVAARATKLSGVRPVEKVHSGRKQLVHQPSVRAAKSMSTSGLKPSEELGRGAPAKLLSAVLMYDEPVPRSRAALVAGVPPTSSTFRNALSKLRVSCYVRDVGDKLEATDDAREKFVVERLPTGQALIEHWKTAMGMSSAPGRLFAALVDVSPGTARPREDVAADAELDADTSTFRNALSKLRVLGLVVDEDGGIKVTPELVA